MLRGTFLHIGLWEAPNDCCVTNWEERDEMYCQWRNGAE